MMGHERNGREGEPSLGISADLVDTILGLVVIGAGCARHKILKLENFNENGVSVEVYKYIEKAQEKLRIRSVEFHPEGILTGGKIAPTRYRGRIDFLVKTLAQFGHYRLYFGIECKLLRAGQPSKTRYYARAGVGKYAEGTYSPGHPMAMLVGYVLDPGTKVDVDPLSDAMVDVGRSMAKHHIGSSPLVDWPRRYRNALVQQNDVPRAHAEPIRLLHAMLRMFP